MSSESLFLRPKLKGDRFEDHKLPVNLMEDFSVLEELIFELAKKFYIEGNPSRKRVPNHFSENVSLKLSNLEEGSVIPNIFLVAVTSLSTPSLPSVSNDYFRYFEQAKNKVFEIVEKANKGEATDLHPKFLNYFNRIGRNLKEGESIDFLNDPSSVRDVIFNRNTRKKILLSIDEKLEYKENIHKYALVPLVNKKAKTFQVEIEDCIVECDLHKDFQEKVLEAFNGYDNKRFISLKGMGIYNKNMKLIHIDRIDSIDILDPFDVSVRLKELSKLEDNWYDGEQGKKLDSLALNQFEKLFESLYKDNLPLPAIFPTISGDLLLEWKKEFVSISLEINLSDFSAILFFFDMNNEENDAEIEIDLSDVNSWGTLNGIIEK